MLPKLILILGSQVVSICTSQKMEPFKDHILTKAADRSCLLQVAMYSALLGCNFKNSHPIASAEAESGKGKARVLLILLFSIRI